MFTLCKETDREMAKIKARELVVRALADLEAVTATEALERMKMPDVVLIDVREAGEREEKGYIPGSIHASRGLLEFIIDPDTPRHNEVFASPKHFIFYCATGARSALAAKVAQDMGIGPVSNLTGGFAAWVEIDAPVERSD
jgi:rhodanese-related sulfurtransferase